MCHYASLIFALNAFILHIQSNNAAVIYQPVSTLTKLLALWIGLAGLELLTEHNKSRQVLTRQKSIFFSPPFLDIQQ